MLMGHADDLSEHGSSMGRLLVHPESEFEDGDEVSSQQILYAASFEELAESNVKYDTIIWVSISLLLVLAWGVGIIMLLYLPIRRYVLQKDISSRKLYVTPSEIVYKVSRPSFIHFWGVTNIEKRVPLSLVIDIIIEQGNNAACIDALSNVFCMYDYGCLLVLGAQAYHPNMKPCTLIFSLAIEQDYVGFLGYSTVGYSLGESFSRFFMQLLSSFSSLQDDFEWKIVDFSYEEVPVMPS